MIIVNINDTTEIEYLLSNPDIIKNTQLVVQLSNGVIYTFPGTINIETSTSIIKIPNLDNIIKVEVEGKCYLEIQDVLERYYRIEHDTIIFQFKKVVNLEFHEEFDINAKIKPKNEIILQQENIKITPVKVGIISKPPPRRREIHSIVIEKG